MLLKFVLIFLKSKTSHTFLRFYMAIAAYAGAPNLSDSRYAHHKFKKYVVKFRGLRH